MIELEYALRYFENSNIILLLNEKISKIKASMLSEFEITNYNSDDTDYYLNIVDKIKSNINNYKSNDGWKIYNILTRYYGY